MGTFQPFAGKVNTGAGLVPVRLLVFGSAPNVNAAGCLVLKICLAMPRLASIGSDVIGRLVEIAAYEIGAGVISGLLTMLEFAAFWSRVAAATISSCVYCGW